jgi:ubiquinone/menaquinone biosynthesis C-methylase UbiE
VGVSRESQAERAARNREARIYDARQAIDKGSAYWRMHNALILRELRRAPPGAVLDAGCGTGMVTAALASTGRAVFGLDFSERMLEVLAEKRLPRVSLAQGNLARIPCRDAAFAAIVSSLVLQHIAPAERALVYAEFRRCLVPGGVLMVIAYNQARFSHSREPLTGSFQSGVPYFSFAHEAIREEARRAGFQSVEARPLGFALFNRVRRGGGFLYRHFGGLLHRIEGAIQPLLPSNRAYASEYWLLVAR